MENTNLFTAFVLAIDESGRVREEHSAKDQYAEQGNRGLREGKCQKYPDSCRFVRSASHHAMGIWNP
jgi:hypothetical protein